MQYPPNPPYGQPQPPSQYPSGPYGQPQPPSQYPSGAYGQPQPPSQYPSGPYGQPQPFPPVPAPVKRGARTGVIIAVLVAILLLLLGGGAFWHYTGPSRTSQAFIEDVLVHYDGSGAYNQLCSEAQAKLSLNQLQQVVSQAKTLGAVWDLSQVTYSLVDEQFFGIAHVRVGGSLTVTAAGHSQTQNLNQSSSSSLFTLRSAGLGWCLTDNNLNLTRVSGGSGIALPI